MFLMTWLDIDNYNVSCYNILCSFQFHPRLLEIVMSEIYLGTGDNARLQDSFIEEVRDLVSDGNQGNDLWFRLTSEPLFKVTHDAFAQAVQDQESEDPTEIDRLGELFDQYVEFVKEVTGKDPS